MNCEKVSCLWSSLSMHTYQSTAKRVGFNLVNVLLGELPLSKGNRIVNFLILYTKQYIFLCLKKGKTPRLMELLFYLRNKYKVEKCIAYQNSEIQKFDNTWQIWKNIFDKL